MRIRAQQRQSGFAESLAATGGGDSDADEGMTVAGAERCQVDCSDSCAACIVRHYQPQLAGRKYIGVIAVDIFPHLHTAHRSCCKTSGRSIGVVLKNKEEVEI